ncbi:hypothetical protein EDEG_01927 [Edhazardia aedis USNM 41457]|uniref:Uncharacterized protein n=1 Tax=Edhazardia aedis (strain USNM 41457) TaxID=1003232 RepID=J9D7K5_EDHAE|nr:hypothetical protein EDEG_01927 [Edhazardia aedis USNM 41457]|eukprot:EJW03771.1 hypothetical protein EDEG_01927 [Edhazardia aedis USNM 41457]
MRINGFIMIFLHCLTVYSDNKNSSFKRKWSKTSGNEGKPFSMNKFYKKKGDNFKNYGGLKESYEKGDHSERETHGKDRKLADGSIEEKDDVKAEVAGDDDEIEEEVIGNDSEAKKELVDDNGEVKKS